MTVKVYHSPPLLSNMAASYPEEVRQIIVIGAGGRILRCAYKVILIFVQELSDSQLL
jgi:hypothetical protein